MKIVMANADLTEFDWIAFLAAWLIALAVVMIQPRGAVVVLLMIPWLAWARRRRQRARLAETPAD